MEGQYEGWTSPAFLLLVLRIPNAFIIRRLLKKTKLVNTLPGVKLNFTARCDLRVQFVRINLLGFTEFECLLTK